jgi:hypothetical protein
MCPYVRFMSADAKFIYPIAFFRPDDVTPGKEEANNFVGDVFGYHAAAEILANTPSSVYAKDGYRWADLCYEHWQNATIFEYDDKGLLIDHYYHSGGRQWMVRNLACVRVEAITGYGGQALNTVYGTKPVTLRTGYNYRLYISSVWGGEPKGDWVDITESPDLAKYGFLDETQDVHRWVWSVDATRYMGAVRQDDQFFLDTLTFNKSAGVIRFSVASDEIHSDLKTYQLMDIPFGQLDILVQPGAGQRWRTLIEGLDYFVRWPQVVINNLEYLGTDVTNVMLRGHGFCNDDMTRYPPSEVGFVEHGVLSNDHRYDIHTHKVQRVVIDGHYRDAKELVFEEQLNALTITNERNGAPYTIQTPPIVFRDVYTSDKLAREEDDARDQMVSDYMSQYYPTRDRGVDFIKEPYHVFSAFTNKILHDLRTGVLNPKGISSGFYSEQDIRTWCKAYEWLVPFDICNNDYDPIHVMVYPHWFGSPVALNTYQWAFFQRVIKLYLRKVPETSVFVYLQE